MAQEVKEFAAKPTDLSLIFRTHTIWELTQEALTDSNMNTHCHTDTPSLNTN